MLDADDEADINYNEIDAGPSLVIDAFSDDGDDEEDAEEIDESL